MFISVSNQFLISNILQFSTHWGKIGGRIISNLCDVLRELNKIGLKILVSGVQVPFLASFKIPPSVGFSCFDHHCITYEELRKPSTLISNVATAPKIVLLSR
jgi:hypothetical protein